MPYEFTLTAVMPASPREIYEAWLDSLAHSRMTGGGARMSQEVDADITAWDGYISGRNLQLIPYQRIIQSWRTTKFDVAHEDSLITLSLEETSTGTLLTLVHSNVPDGQTSYERGGWETHYFAPMRAYFAKRRRAAAKKAPSDPAPVKPARAKAARAKSRPDSTKLAAKSQARRAKSTAKAKAKPSSARARPGGAETKRRPPRR
jgi:uncharacterized protein YndB with AHSA1/START domain